MSKVMGFFCIHIDRSVDVDFGVRRLDAALAGAATTRRELSYLPQSARNKHRA